MTIVRRFTLHPQAFRFLLAMQVAPLFGLSGCLDLSDLPRAHKRPPEPPDSAQDPEGPRDGGPEQPPSDGEAAPVPPTDADASPPGGHEPDGSSPQTVPDSSTSDHVPDPDVDSSVDEDPRDPGPVTRVYGAHVTVLKSADQKWTAGFGPGRYRASHGDFALLGGKVPRVILVPQAVSVMLCAHETESGGEDCFMYAGGLAPAPENIADALATGVTYMEIAPHVLRFQWAKFEAASTRIDVGSNQYLARLDVRSLFVPPGVRLRMCKDAARTNCTMVDDPVPDIDAAGLGRWVEVLHVVTAFAEPYGDGERRAFGLGAFDSGNEPLGSGEVGSLFIPYPLKARVCSGALCEDYDRSQLPLPESLLGQVTNLKVESGIVR